MTKLDVGKPFRNDVQKRSIEPDCRANYGDDNPALSSIVRFSYPMSPVEPAGVPKPSISLAARLSAQLFSCRILHPIWSPIVSACGSDISKVYHTNGCKVLLGRQLVAAHN